jgi:hypothetical protein
MSKIINFNGFICNFQLHEYVNGGTAITLVDTDDGMPVATASLWIGNLFHDEIAIKDYSENEGMVEALLEAGLIYPPHRSVNGHPVVRLVKQDIRENFS